MPLFFGRTNCDLQIPYKIDPNPWKQHQNWLAIERWATYLTRNCLPAGSGSCLTATLATETADLSSGAAVTARWAPKAAMNLTQLQVRAAFAPSDADLTLTLVDEVGATTLATVTLTSGVDTEDTWTGTVAVTPTMRLYFAADTAAVSAMQMLCAQAWFDGPGGGGLIFYPEPGA
jgi:hypothetical protein